MTDDRKRYSWSELQQELANLFEEQKALRVLRLSVARIAQRLGVPDAELLNDPIVSSRECTHGWNSLAAGCLAAIDELQHREGAASDG